MTDKNVLIGFSGGVDSSTATFLLKKAGYEVTGVTFVINEDWSKENNDFAKTSANNLGIKHIFVNVEKTFNELVVSEYIKSIRIGETLSPCPLCNDIFKFSMLKQIADRENIKYISTGHYARIKKISDIPYIQKGIDPLKDQSYMLYRLNTEIRKRLILPLGEYNKKEIREIASNNNLIPALRPDSQGLCFAQQGYTDFILSAMKNEIKAGDFTLKDGKILGKHKGYQLYTVGQRRGLGVNFNSPLFITEIIPDKNIIILGPFDELKKEEILLDNYILHNKYETDFENILFIARARFSSQGHPAKIVFKNNKLLVKYPEPNPENAPGQHIVFYDDDIVAGGGVIIKGHL